MADNMTPQQRSYTMSRIRSKNSRAEMMLRRTLHARGLRYRLHGRNLKGRPDLIFSRARLAIFVDGDFWHGWNFDAVRPKLSDKWRIKIEGNMRRDRETTAALQASGWHVLRFWEHEVIANAEACADRVCEVIVHT